jgi:hypothetical protein
MPSIASTPLLTNSQKGIQDNTLLCSVAHGEFYTLTVL